MVHAQFEEGRQEIFMDELEDLKCRDLKYFRHFSTMVLCGPRSLSKSSQSHGLLCKLLCKQWELEPH